MAQGAWVLETSSLEDITTVANELHHVLRLESVAHSADLHVAEVLRVQVLELVDGSALVVRANAGHLSTHNLVAVDVVVDVVVLLGQNVSVVVVVVDNFGVAVDVVGS